MSDRQAWLQLRAEATKARRVLGVLGWLWMGQFVPDAHSCELPRAKAFCARHIVLSPFPTGTDGAQHRLSLCRAGTVATAQKKAHDVPRHPGHRHQGLLFNCLTLCGLPFPFSLRNTPAPLPECPGKTFIHHVDLALVQ